MYPTAAGKLASHGPYAKVSDIYRIPNLTRKYEPHEQYICVKFISFRSMVMEFVLSLEHDVKLFKSYDKFFTVNPPGHAFHERINGRVST